jgi:hypothetical protein
MIDEATKQAAQDGAFYLNELGPSQGAQFGEQSRAIFQILAFLDLPPFDRDKPAQLDTATFIYANAIKDDGVWSAYPFAGAYRYIRDDQTPPFDPGPPPPPALDPTP